MGVGEARQSLGGHLWGLQRGVGQASSSAHVWEDQHTMLVHGPCNSTLVVVH